MKRVERERLESMGSLGGCSVAMARGFGLEGTGEGLSIGVGVLGSLGCSYLGFADGMVLTNGYRGKRHVGRFSRISL